MKSKDMIDTDSVIIESQQRYADDYRYVQLLISGESCAWDTFYKEFSHRLELFINKKYPNVFNEVAIDEISAAVRKRLGENDYRALRSYRGECTFSTYITKAAEWVIIDWRRKHTDRLFEEPIDSDEDFYTALDQASFRQLSPSRLEENDSKIPDIVKSLNDDLRWAFLLRYYDYFGFPFDEIRLLAKKKGVSISSVTQSIINYLEPEGDDVLCAQRKKQIALQDKLEKICYKVNKLNIKEQQFLDDAKYVPNDSLEGELGCIRNKRLLLEEKREALLNGKSKIAITTPYEVIAEILGEVNVGTIRSRVFNAKKQLKQMLLEKAD